MASSRSFVANSTARPRRDVKPRSESRKISGGNGEHDTLCRLAALTAPRKPLNGHQALAAATIKA